LISKLNKVTLLTDPRTQKDRARIYPVLRRVKSELDSLGVAWQDTKGIDLEELVPDPDSDLFLVIGGDGTMIHFAGHLSKYGLPYFGLNYGNVGFMMNPARKFLSKTLHALRDGKYTVGDFPLLEIVGTDCQGNVHSGLGLNDVFIQRMTPQACKIEVEIGGEELAFSPILCDGIILSTPLGSTAYAYSVTRSIVAVDVPVIAFTPIAANRNFPARNILFPIDTRFSFKVLEPVKRKVQMVNDSFSLGNLTEAEVFLSKTKVQLCFLNEPDQSLAMRCINKMS